MGLGTTIRDKIRDMKYKHATARSASLVDKAAYSKKLKDEHDKQNKAIKTIEAARKAERQASPIRRFASGVTSKMKESRKERPDMFAAQRDIFAKDEKKDNRERLFGGSGKGPWG